MAGRSLSHYNTLLFIPSLIWSKRHGDGENFSIIKPDAVAKNVIGKIISRFEKAGLRIVASRMERLSVEKAKGFYAEHEGKGFFEDLVGYMCSGPVIVQVLEGRRDRT